MRKILVYPFYNNPYQKLLYTEVKKESEISIKYLSEDVSKFGGNVLLIALPLYILKNRLQGFSIFHLHWVIFTKLPETKLEKYIFFLYSLFLIYFIKIIGYKLIWTIHNIFPHNTLTINDPYVTKVLCEISDRKIVHSETTVKELKNLGFNINNINIIPHGNYVDGYKNIISKNEAKDYLQIDKTSFVFLFFGEIKQYKGVDTLLDVFTTTIVKKYKKVLLIIAGKVYDDSLQGRLKLYSQNISTHIKLFLQHIPDDEVQYFMKAADVVVYPFKRITTSGSVLLALSFGKAIVYPQSGSLQELPQTLGFTYSTLDENGLSHAMEEAINSKKNILQEREKSAYTYAQSLSWEKIANQTIAIYKQI